MKKIISIFVIIMFISACKKSSTPNPVPLTPIIDFDGNVYDTVKIGSQLWLKQNLNTSHYRNGDPIPKVTDQAAWYALTTGAYCYYDNDSATYASIYGKLYNWYAVNDARGIGPKGFHVPSDAEWTTLTTGLGGNAVAGNAMKETGTTRWLTPNTGATNSSGFTGLPGGFRYFNGGFSSIGSKGYWWITTEFNAPTAWDYYLNNNDGLSNKDYNFKQHGFSVRCLKD